MVGPDPEGSLSEVDEEPELPSEMRLYSCVPQ
jgi:hypothetical protein